MNLKFTKWLLAASLFAGASFSGYARADYATNGQPLLESLRQGGYVIVMRHATTEAKPDASPVDLANCSTQRNLTAEGRALARSIGSTLSDLGIPIGRVESSPFCRAAETATLAFGHDETVLGLGEKSPKNPSTAAEAASTLRPLIASAVTPGTNTVVVTHGFNIKSVVGADFAEGEAAVFRPDGKGGFSLVARVLPQDWFKLQAAQLGPNPGLDVHVQPIDPAGGIEAKSSSA